MHLAFSLARPEFSSGTGNHGIVLIVVHLPLVRGPEQTRASNRTPPSNLQPRYYLSNQLFGDFLDFVVLFSQDLDAESLLHFERNLQQTLVLSFGSMSPEAEGTLWNLRVSLMVLVPGLSPSTQVSANAIFQYEIFETFSRSCIVVRDFPRYLKILTTIAISGKFLFLGTKKHGD
jgi:hypothetical protein